MPADDKFTKEQKQKAIDELLAISGHLGISIDEVTTMVGLILEEMGSCGISGSEAGKSLRKAIRKLDSHGESGISPGYKPWQTPAYTCPDCKEKVNAIGIAGACIICDPRGFDNHG